MAHTDGGVLELRLLGAPSLRTEQGLTPPSLGWGKPLALLAMLAVRGEARRDEVVDLLWRNVEEGRARNAFRQALHRLRSALGDDMLPQDRERLRLVRSGRLSLDLERFEASANAGRFEEAIAEYGGDFLENAILDEAPFDMWAEQERVRIRARFRHVLEGAVTQAAGAGRWQEAIARSRRLLTVAPFETSAAQLAATTLLSAGRRSEAQELLRQFGTRLSAELGLPMPSEIQGLLARIERQHLSTPGGAPATSAQGELPLAGREGELSRLLALWRRVSPDSGALALIEGDAGIGKSRLADELAAAVRSLGPVTVLRGRERSVGVHLPYGVVAEALRGLLRAPGVLGASRHLLAEAARLLPDLRDVADLPDVQDVQDDAARLRFFEGVAALIDAAAFERPVLLVLEDLHAIAPSSLDLLSYLVVRLAGSPVMFALTLRPADALPGSLTRLRALATSASGPPPHGAGAAAISLQPLSHSDVTGLATAEARRLGVPEGLVHRIVARAGGLPAQLVELLRKAALGEDIGAQPISLRDLALERLQRLSSAERRLFVVMSLVGRPISDELAGECAHLSRAATAEAIGALIGAGLVRRDESRVWTNSVAARFAVEAAGNEARAFLSGWIAQALATAPDVPAADLARFHAAAGNSVGAYDAARRAAFDALAMGAVPEATQFLTLARTFASSPDQQRDIDGFLAAIGAGRRQLGAGAAQSTTPEVLERPDEASAGTRVDRESRQHTLVQGWFPNWRILLGAAIATLAISAALLNWRGAALLPAARVRSVDTLVVAEEGVGRTVRYVTGDLLAGFVVSNRYAAPPSDPAWMDSLSGPWVSALASPRGGNVALTRVTPASSDVFVLSADRRDTLPVAVGRGDAQPLGWSPDGQWLLVQTNRRLSDSSFDGDLLAYRVVGAPERLALDTTSRRSVTEAAWSPDGSRIAWVARVGTERQQEVFTSLADGSHVQNVSHHPADDFHIAWSSNGDVLAFTSTRDGNANIYTAALREDLLWRRTSDPAQDDRALFSANGQMIAFESTRGGAAAVYVMPSLGGEPRRVGAGLSLSGLRWLGDERRFVNRVRAEIRPVVEVNDTATIRLTVTDQFDEAVAPRDVDWTILDTALLQPSDSAARLGDDYRIVARAPGLARVVASVGHWRDDTAFVRIGRRGIHLVGTGGANPLAEWVGLGVPAPSRLGPPGEIALNADREWDSGILSRKGIPLVPGLVFDAVVRAPVGSAPDAATSLSVSLVAPEQANAIDTVAPQFLRYASFSWSAEAGRLAYAVGREIFTEPFAANGDGDRELRVTLRIEADSTVSFALSGKHRWRSTLRVIEPRRGSRALAWIAGRATADRVRLVRADVTLSVPESLSSP